MLKVLKAIIKECLIEMKQLRRPLFGILGIVIPLHRNENGFGLRGEEIPNMKFERFDFE